MVNHLLTMSLLAIVLVLICPATVMADERVDLEGEYTIYGWDPGNTPEGDPDYTGKATLTPWGDTWRYHGFMDDMTYAGAGIYDPEFQTLCVSFINGDGSERGVSFFRFVGGQLKGVWAMDNGGDGKLGAEVWIRKQ